MGDCAELPEKYPPGSVSPEPHPDAPPPGTRLDAHHDGCFGCGSGRRAGLGLTAIAGEGVSVVARFTVTEEHTGAPGLAHGGILAAAMDDACGMVLWLLRRPYVTSRLDTEFLRPVPVGATLHITARCVAIHGRRAFLRADARLGPDGPIAVHADAVFARVRMRHFTEHGSADAVELLTGQARPGE